MHQNRETARPAWVNFQEEYQEFVNRCGEMNYSKQNFQIVLYLSSLLVRSQSGVLHDTETKKKRGIIDF